MNTRYLGQSHLWHTSDELYFLSAVRHTDSNVKTVGGQYLEYLCHVNALRVQTFQEEPEGLDSVLECFRCSRLGSRKKRYLGLVLEGDEFGCRENGSRKKMKDLFYKDSRQ